MAATPSPFPAFPSATTYPPHPCGYYPPPIPYPSSVQIHGGYYPPPPYLAGYGSAPPTFPNPHPASAYGPPPGFVPVPTYAPAPAPPRPSPTHQHPPDLWSPPPMSSSALFPFGSCPASAYEQSFYPAQPYKPHWPSPAPDPNTSTAPSTPTSGHPLVASSPSPELNPVRVSQPVSAEKANTATVRRPEGVPSTRIPCGRSSTPPRLLDTVPISPNRERIPLQNRLEMEPCRSEKSRALRTGEKGAGKTGIVLHPATPDLTMGNNAGDESMYDELVHKHRGLEILSVGNTGSNHHSATHQAQPQFSFDSLHGEILKLSASISQFAVAMGLQTTEAQVTGSPSAAASTQSRSPVTTASRLPDTIVPAAPAPVASQVFGEMPTPIFLQETHGTAPGQYNPSQNSRVSTNLSDQNLDATPPVIPSAAEKVRVMAPPLVAAQAEGLAPVLCPKVNIITGSESLLVPNLQRPMNVQDASHVFKETALYDICEVKVDSGKSMINPERPTDGVFSFTNEMKQDSDQHFKCFSRASETEQTSTHVSYYAIEQEQNGETASVDVQQLRTPRLNLLEIDETRKEWDTESNSLKYVLQSFSHPPMLSSSFILRYCSVKGNSWLNIVRQSMSDHVEGLKPLSLTTPWDPGTSTSLHSSRAKICNQVATYGISPDLQFTFSDDKNVIDCCDLRFTSFSAVRLVDPLLYYSQRHGVANRETVQWDPGIGTHSSMYIWLHGWTASIATGKPLSWLQNSELATWQSVMTSVSSIWDPGIDSPLSVYFWLHLHMFQLVYCSAIHACHLVSVLLPLTQLTAKGSNNIENDELTLSCLVFHQHLIASLTSTTPKVIRSFEYRYTRDCLSGQWEFLHQQGFQNDYKATNRISPQNYLQLSEMVIIFMTFLPP